MLDSSTASTWSAVFGPGSERRGPCGPGEVTEGNLLRPTGKFLLLQDIGSYFDSIPVILEVGRAGL
jgi:hypothetical protein